MASTSRHPYLSAGGVLLIGLATLAGATLFAAHAIDGTGATAPTTVTRRLDQPTSMVPGHAPTTITRRLDQPTSMVSGHAPTTVSFASCGRPVPERAADNVRSLPPNAGSVTI